MMLHHHTKFGNKMFCGSEDNIQTNIHDILNLRCDLHLERSNPIFAQDTPVSNAVLTKQVWLQTDQQFGRYSRKRSYFDYISPSCDPGIEDSEPIFLRDTSSHDTTPSLVKKKKKRLSS